MKALPVLAAWGAFAAMSSLTYADSDPFDLAAVYAAENFDGTSTHTLWTDCGQINAFYDVDTQTVYLCNELRGEDPAFIRFIYAHEIAHGVIHQLDIPITGSEEAAADELAAWVLVGAGRSRDVMVTSKWWWDHPALDIPYDAHPSHTKRAFTLACYFLGSEGEVAPFCESHTPWPRVVQNWAKLLHVGEFASK